MNSLENLNNWANDSLAYGDQNTYSITFSASSPTNQTVSITEDSAFASPVGIDITSVISAPRALVYEIDLSAITLPVVFNCPTLPYYLNSTVVDGKTFRVTGAIDENTWALLEGITVQISDQGSNFSYTSTITYPDPSNTESDLTKSWTVSVTVTNSPELSDPTAYVYVKNSPGTIAGTPTVLNASSGPYTMVITPSDTNAVYLLSSPMYGVPSVFNPVSKTLTITNATKTQLNNHLAAIYLTTGTNVQNSFNLTYTLTNPTGLISSVVQPLSSDEPFTIDQVTYLEDTPFNIQQSVNDESASATSFTLTVAQTTPLPSVSPGYFTVNGSNVGNSWTISNTRTNINSANVVYTPPVDYTSGITFTVNLSKVDNGNTQVQITNGQVNITNAGANPEISNMINRSYTANTVNNIFSSQTPYINDGSDVGQSYTITLTSSLGKFGNSAVNATAASSYSFTGNLSACNSELASMVFVPNASTYSTGTYTYTQSRNGTAQVNSSFSLTGTNATLTPATYTFTSGGTWNPTFEQAYYGNVEMLIVGGGGGSTGIAETDGDSNYGAGGGGGQVLVKNFSPSGVRVNYTTWGITIGSGGSSAAGIFTGSNYSLGPASAGGNTVVTGSSEGTYTAPGGGGGFSSYTAPSTYVNTGGARGGTGGGNGGGLNQLGGTGTLSSISGTAVYYGSGGNGARNTNEYRGSTPTLNNGRYPGAGGGGGKGRTTPPPAYGPGNGADGIVIIKVS